MIIRYHQQTRFSANHTPSLPSKAHVRESAIGGYRNMDRRGCHPDLLKARIYRQYNSSFDTSMV